MPRRQPAALPGLLPLLTLLAACGGGDGPAGPGPVTPMPGDTLLAGSAGTRAIDAVRGRSPDPAPRSEIVGRFIRTRLTAVVRPDATVGEVNAALLAAGARIEGSDAGSPFLTLRIPAVADPAAALALGRQLTASGAFWQALPSYEVDPDLVAVLPPSGDTGTSHLLPGRLPAAWNARGLIGTTRDVVLPDVYHQLAGLASVSALRFGATRPQAATPNENHGFHVAGILAADHDETAFTGAFPDAARLRLHGVGVGGLPFLDIYRAMIAAFPAAGPFVMSTSLGYRFTDAPGQRLDLATLALAWRWTIAADLPRFVHLTSAGNSGRAAAPVNEARWRSPWALAALEDDLRPLLRGAGLSASDSTAFEALWAWAQANRPAAVVRLPNTLVVGSSDRAGTESAFSSRGAHLRTVGEEVYAPCVVRDADFATNPSACSGTAARYSGTSMATPLAAGVAAYLWALRPALTPVQLRARLQQAYDEAAVPGVLDAYHAVQRLDAGLTDAPIRRELLDVATATGPGRDGRFDEHDVAAFLDAFAAYRQQRVAGASVNDHSRYDLNGNGLTGDSTRRAAFDLNADGDVTRATFVIEGDSREYDERVLSDRQILCYYAYTPLYQGDPVARRDALVACRTVTQEEPPPPDVPPSRFDYEDVSYSLRRGNDFGQGDCTSEPNFLPVEAPSGNLPLAYSRTATCSFPDGNVTVRFDDQDDGRGRGSFRMSSDGRVQASAGPDGVVDFDRGVDLLHELIILPESGDWAERRVANGRVRIRAHLTLPALPFGCPGSLSQGEIVAEFSSGATPETMTLVLLRTDQGCQQSPNPRTVSADTIVDVPLPYGPGVITSFRLSLNADILTVVRGGESVTSEAVVEYEWLGIEGLPAGSVVLHSSGFDWSRPADPLPAAGVVTPRAGRPGS